MTLEHFERKYCNMYN